jgi:hypothetical protein
MGTPLGDVAVMPLRIVHRPATATRMATAAPAKTRIETRRFRGGLGGTFGAARFDCRITGLF